MTTIYRCDDFRPIHLDDSAIPERTPAQVFAERLARKEFGRRGHVRTLNLVTRNEDRTAFNYETFIGRSARGEGGATAGRNVQFTVYREEI